MTIANDDLSPINGRVIELLRAKGVSNRQLRGTLAKTCGISVQAVSQWFSTTKSIKHEHLLSIAKAFNTTVDWLLTGDEPVKQERLPPTGNPEVRAIINSSRQEIIELANALEGKDMTTAFKLLQISIQLEKAKDAL